MDLTGKMFRNSIRILNVNGILEKHAGEYNCSFLDKALHGYIVISNVKYSEDTIVKYFSECSNTDIISKVKHMFSMNYVACRSIANGIEYVKSSDYSLRILNYGIILMGPCITNIFETYINFEPLTVIYGAFHLDKPIAEEDYYKIFNKVKKLKEDLDKLWTDVV